MGSRNSHMSAPVKQQPQIDAIDIGVNNGPAVLESPPSSPSSGGLLYNKWKQKCLHGLLNNDTQLMSTGLSAEGADPNAFLEAEEDDVILLDDQPDASAKRDREQPLVGFFPKYLLTEGAGQTMLQYAAAHDYPEICHVLLEAGASKTIQSLQGQNVREVAQGSCAALFSEDE